MATEKRLIDADALKHLTCEWCNRTRPEEPCEPSECAIMWFYDGLPTVDAVEVVRGRWEPHMEEMEDGFGKFEPVQTGLRCSVCGRYSCCGGNFCKDCGAKMDGKP